MNKVILMGRLVREPEVRYSSGANGTFAERRRKTMEEKGYWFGKKIKVVE